MIRFRLVQFSLSAFCTAICTIALVTALVTNSIVSTANGQTEDVPSTQIAKRKIAIPDIPEGITSFGGAVIGDRMFVYGGHTGDAHSYYESGQNKELFVIDLRTPQEWKSLGKGLGLQGLAMVGYKENLYRLGGFHAHNKKGEKHDLRSVKDFARFDFNSKKWIQLEPMPEPRSSFDAVVKDGVIYVVGGWAMRGTEGTVWSENAYSYDLKLDKGKWVKLPAPPFKRRALSVGFQGNKIVAIGGMQPKGGVTNNVALYDIQSKKWTEGPSLPKKGRMEGFGSSCFNVGGQLVVSTYGGNVYQMSKDAAQWKSIKKLDDGRFFHRLLPLTGNQFALVGGASMESGKFYEVEILQTSADESGK